MSVIAVIGLGSVGMPFMVEIGKYVRTIGFDVNLEIVAKCRAGTDPSKQFDETAMATAIHAEYTGDPRALAEADIIIIAVPTPVDTIYTPDFKALIGASIYAGRHMKRGATVVYESTGFPAATQEICIPVLERESGLIWLRDFYVSCSPEPVKPESNDNVPASSLKLAPTYRRIISRALVVKAASSQRMRRMRRDEYCTEKRTVDQFASASISITQAATA